MESLSMRLDDLQLASVSGGRLWLDGGNMFGVVPRVLWEKKAPPDEHNRILLETNCLLVRTDGKTALVDTGYGAKATPRERAHFNLQAGEVLLDNLHRQGLGPEDIDIVILTHLHFDHAGGATGRDAAGRLRPTFPRARHFVQRAEWEDATANLPELAGAYFEQDFLPLEEAGLVELVEGEAEVLPGLRVQPAPGHTRGHQIVRLGRGDRQAVYLGDLCPTVAHLPTFWTMAYDQFPLQVRRTKPRVLADITAAGHLALFDHDPHTQAAYLTPDPKRGFAVREAVRV